VSVLVVGGVTALVYLGVLAVLRVPELRELLAPVRRILRRG
jgi:hypothetical protein